MASKEIDVKLKLDAKQAQADLKAFSGELDDLDPETTVKVTADTDTADSDIATVGEGLDRIDSMDVVADIKVNIDQAEAQVEGMQAKIKGAGDEAKTTGGHIGGMRHEAEQSKSVLANMVGNSAQDISNLGGVAGTAGLAIGQLGEYATEGNISLKGLASVAGPMAGLTVATLALSQGAKQAAEAEKRLKEEIGKLSTETDKQVISSLTKMMLDQVIAGHSLADVWTNIASTNIEGARRLRDLMEAQGLTEGQTKGLTDAIAEQERVTAQAEVTHQKYGDAVTTTGAASQTAGEALLEQSRNTDLTREATERATEWEAKHAQELDNTKTASQHLSDALDAQKHKTDDLISSERAAVDKKYAFRKATEDTQASLENLNTVLKDHKSTQDDVKAATDTAFDSILNQSVGYATLKGAALDSKEGIERQIDSLKLTEAALAPNSPLRKNIDEYIKDLENIPTSVNTTLTVTQQSIIASGGQIPGFRGKQAAGGVFKATPGGYLVTVAEGGKDEAIIPLENGRIPGSGGGGNTTIINNWPPGVSPVAYAQAQREYHRRGGR